MGDSTTLNTAKPSFRFGPVYQDEFRTPEVRSLNATSKELWVALAFRTRSAKGGPEAISGMTVRYSDLAADLGKLNPKTGTVKPVAKKNHSTGDARARSAGLGACDLPVPATTKGGDASASNNLWPMRRERQKLSTPKIQN